jgi:isopenicillin N synthase-like dioxygenase
MSSVTLGEGGGISIVDFGPFLDGSKKQEVGDAMLDSFERIGFVYLKNHGLPQEKIDVMFNWVCYVY